MVSSNQVTWKQKSTYELEVSFDELDPGGVVSYALKASYELEVTSYELEVFS